MPTWAPIALVVVAIAIALYFIGSSGGTNKTTPSPTGLSAGARHRARPKPHKTVLPAPPQLVHLQLVPTGTVYVCLVNAHTGRKLINEQTFSAGQAVPPVTGRKLLLTLGNASIQVKVNGHAVPIAASPNAIRLLLTPTTPPQKVPFSMTPTCP